MKNLIFAFIFLFGLTASAHCLAKNEDDYFAVSTCRGRNESICKWENDCRWSYSGMTGCEARDEFDSYSQLVCPGQSETMCKWENNCVWNYE